jgi:hypothetical protein
MQLDFRGLATGISSSTVIVLLPGQRASAVSCADAD